MIPPLNTLAEQIEEISGAPHIDPDIPLAQISDVDSMDLMEWLYDFQSENPGASVEATVFANEDGAATLRVIHERLLAAVGAQAV